jgi:putative FmdB family regulatory protein
LPLYEYKCKSCGTLSEIRHGFKESVSEPCAACGGELTRVFNAAGIVFKGSGFYVNDSRKASGSNGGKTVPSDNSKSASGDAASSGDSAKSSEPAKSSETSTAGADSSPKTGGDAPKSGPSGKSDAAA